MKNKLVVRVLIALIFLGATAFLVLNENGLLKYLKDRK